MARSSTAAFDVGPFFGDLDQIIREHSDPEQRKKAFVDFTRTEIAKADEGNAAVVGRQVPKTIATNGIVGAPIESIRPGNSVFVEWKLLEEVIQWIGAELLDASPVLTGRYQRSHVFFVDGRLHDPDGKIPDGEVYHFVNTQPYARKIEGNRNWRPPRPPLSRQAPNGVYQVVAAIAASKFGNIASITFTYIAPDGGADEASRNPAIEIRARR